MRQWISAGAATLLALLPKSVDATCDPAQLGWCLERVKVSRGECLDGCIEPRGCALCRANALRAFDRCYEAQTCDSGTGKICTTQGCVCPSGLTGCSPVPGRLGVEPSTDRPGGDYAHAAATDAAACRARCQGESACAAYTYVRPTGRATQGTCWLKATAPPPIDATCCTSGARGGVLDLVVVTANMAGYSELPASASSPAADWKVRHRRLADELARAGAPPDLISLTEQGGWESCILPLFRAMGDYDSLDVFVDRMAERTGIVYRIAYLVAPVGAYGPLGRCQVFTGDAVLYNPVRLLNRTPDDAAGKSLETHDSTLQGVQLRRSLPICSRGSSLRPLHELIDGAQSVEKCALPTPTGPAWALMQGRAVATLARFAFVHDQRATFDLFTLHPTQGIGPAVAQPLRDFILGLSASPYRQLSPMVQTLVVGDLNDLSHVPWLPGFGEVYGPANDPLAVLLPTARGSERHSLQLSSGVQLPAGSDCKGKDPTVDFSDHCALRVELREP